MSIFFENIQIHSVRTQTQYYDPKKKKHLKYKEPKVTKKLLFKDDDCYDVGELFIQLKNCHDRAVYDNELQVSFTSKFLI